MTTAKTPRAPARKRTAASAASNSPTPAAEPASRPYHHGDLPQALLAAAEAVLVRDGLAGLGLRSIAREAGVSHTAPKHHFGDTTALLSELAAVGFRRLAAAMLAAAEAAQGAAARRNAVGSAYVQFAAGNAALYSLMFRNERIDMKHAPLARAARDAMRIMAPTIGDEAQVPAASAPAGLSAQDAMRLTAAWAYVHGLASLLIDQRLGGIMKATTAFRKPGELVESVLREVRMGLDFASSPQQSA